MDLSYSIGNVRLEISTLTECNTHRCNYQPSRLLRLIEFHEPHTRLVTCKPITALTSSGQGILKCLQWCQSCFSSDQASANGSVFEIILCVKQS